MLLNGIESRRKNYKVVQIWPGLFVCKQVTVFPGHIWTTLYLYMWMNRRWLNYSKRRQIAYRNTRHPLWKASSRSSILIVAAVWNVSWYNDLPDCPMKHVEQTKFQNKIRVESANTGCLRHSIIHNPSSTLWMRVCHRLYLVELQTSWRSLYRFRAVFCSLHWIRTRYVRTHRR